MMLWRNIMFIQKITNLLAFLILSFAGSVLAQQEPLVKEVQITSNISYALVDGFDLKLDLYLPRSTSNPELMIFIHGGAWRGGSKDGWPINRLANSFAEDGMAVASVEFRMSHEGMFPAQIHDIKAAIRFLRGNANSFGYNADKIGILGASSGGHLVAMMGVSNGHPLLEGSVGDYDNVSSDVHAVVSYYGASNLHSILRQSTPHGLSVRKPALDLLIGGQPADMAELATLASPVALVSPDSAPLLMMHGDQDPQMPINQSHELHSAYKDHQIPVQFEVVHGAAHHDAVFYNDESNAVMKSFLLRYVR
jgi:acetyl esterase/lipase